MTGGSNFSRLKIFQLLLQLLGSRPACDFRRVQSTPAWSRSSQLGSRCWVRRNTKYIFCSVFVCHLQRNALNASFVPLMLTLVPLHWCWHSSTIFPWSILYPLLLVHLSWFPEISSSFSIYESISLTTKFTAGHFDYEEQGGAKNKTPERVFEVPWEETYCPSLKGSSNSNTTSYPITKTSHPNSISNPTTNTSQQHSTATILRPKRGRPVGQPPTEATLRRRRKVLFAQELIFCTFLA